MEGELRSHAAIQLHAARDTVNDARCRPFSFPIEINSFSCISATVKVTWHRVFVPSPRNTNQIVRIIRIVRVGGFGVISVFSPVK